MAGFCCALTGALPGGGTGGGIDTIGGGGKALAYTGFDVIIVGEAVVKFIVDKSSGGSFSWSSVVSLRPQALHTTLTHVSISCCVSTAKK